MHIVSVWTCLCMFEIKILVAAIYEIDAVQLYLYI
jgi:hypothetical protein